MPRGGARKGAGHPKVPLKDKAKRRSFCLYDWELRQIADYALTHNISESEALRIALRKGFPILWTDTLLDNIPIKRKKLERNGGLELRSRKAGET